LNTRALYNLWAVVHYSVDAAKLLEELKATAYYQAFSVGGEQLCHSLTLRHLYLLLHVSDFLLKDDLLSLDTRVWIDLAENRQALLITALFSKPPLGLGHEEHGQKLNCARYASQTQHQPPIMAQEQAYAS